MVRRCGGWLRCGAAVVVAVPAAAARCAASAAFTRPSGCGCRRGLRPTSSPCWVPPLPLDGCERILVAGGGSAPPRSHSRREWPMRLAAEFGARMWGAAVPALSAAVVTTSEAAWRRPFTCVYASFSPVLWRVSCGCKRCLPVACVQHLRTTLNASLLCSCVCLVCLSWSLMGFFIRVLALPPLFMLLPGLCLPSACCSPRFASPLPAPPVGLPPVCLLLPSLCLPSACTVPRPCFSSLSPPPSYGTRFS